MIKIGLSKGRIEDSFIKQLIDKKILIDDIKESRRLTIDIDEYELCLIKSIDIINLLINGCIDIGILGSDIIDEINSDEIINLMDFDTGNCYFALSSFPNMDLDNIRRVATKYPNIAANLLKEINLNSQIVKMNGSVEIAPNIDYADAIIDIVETGNTLKANGLKELVRFNDISTRIITRKYNNNLEIKNLIKRLR